MRGLFCNARGRRVSGLGALWLALFMASALGSQAQGLLWAWGDNTYGILGNGMTGEGSAVPGRVIGPNDAGSLLDITQVASGSPDSDGSVEYVLALRSDGTVWAWGDDSYGELGNGITTATLQTTPVQVVGPKGSGYLTGITQVATADFCSLAVKSDGTVWIWGGIGGAKEFGVVSATPVQVSGLTGITRIVAGSQISALGYALALDKNGNVWAWGDNSNSAFGNGTTTSSATPVRALSNGGGGYLTGITQIVTSNGGVYNFNLALDKNGNVWAWGNNELDQLGNPTVYATSTPVQVVGPNGSGSLTGITQIIANDISGYALRNDGTVWAWGYDNLGNGTSNSSAVPVQVVGPNAVGYLTGITALAAGTDVDEDVILALRNDGTVWAWGDNTLGLLGNPNATGSAPSPVVSLSGTGDLTGIVQIATGYGVSYALRDDGALCTWGGNVGANPIAVAINRTVSLASASTASVYALTGYQLVWHNTQTGDTVQWLLDGFARVASSEILAGVPATWKIAGTADFNGDGFPDILWQNQTTGEIDVWEMTGGQYLQATQIEAPYIIPTFWHIVGVANLTNASGVLNILWQNVQNGEIGYWTLVNGTVSSYTELMGPGDVSVAWQIVGTPDFFGTGFPEILFQNRTTGEIGYWSLDNGSYQSYTQITKPGLVPTAWHIVATPDVNGDGQSDLVFQNVMTGEVGYWIMSKGQPSPANNYTQISAPGAVPLAWQIGGAL